MSKKQDVIDESRVAEPPLEPVTSKEIVTDELAAELYGKYCAVINPKTNVPLPSWLQLDELYRDAWRAVVS